MEEKVNHSFNEEFIYPDDRNSSLIDGNNENNIFYDEIFKSTFNCKDPTYHELLEKKIRDQAKRLLDLQNYINLCEKRIKQINPTNLLPITEEQIGHLSNKELKSSDSDNHNLIIQVRNLKSLLKLKDQEIMNHIRKYDTLILKYNKSVDGTLPADFDGFTEKNKTNFNFPSVEKVSNEKIREAYSKLHNYVKAIIEQKNQISENLRKETINNEQHRNYIDVLKQTIDSTISKLNISNCLQSQKAHYNDNMSVSNIDVLIDFTRLKNESDKYKKEYLLSNIIINELKQEIQQYIKANDEMKNRKEKINQTLESGIMELEQARKRVIKLEEEKYCLNKEVDNLKQELGCAINDYNLLLREFENLRTQYSNRLESTNKTNEEKSAIINNLESQIESIDKIVCDSSIGSNNSEEKAQSNKKNWDEQIKLIKKNRLKIEELSKANHDLIQKLDNLKEAEKKFNFNLNEKETIFKTLESDIKSRDIHIHELKRNLDIFKEKLNELNREMYLKDEEIKKIKDNLKEKDFSISNLHERIEELLKINKKVFHDESLDLLNELKYKKETFQDNSKTFKSLNDNFKVTDEKSKIAQDNQIINFLTRKNDESIVIIENLKNEINKLENIKKLDFTDRNREKDGTKIYYTFNEAKNIINSILNTARKFNNRILLNQEVEELNESFLENIEQFRFSLIQLNNINFVEVIQSIETWIKTICEEFEVYSKKIKDKGKKDGQIISNNNEKYVKNLDEIEVSKYYLQLKKLRDENEFLRSENEILSKKIEKQSKENKVNKNDNMKHLHDYDNINFEMSKLCEFNNKIAGTVNQIINDEMTRILIKEIKSLNSINEKIYNFIKTKEVKKLIKEYSINIEQLYQYERDILKLKQKLMHFEGALEKVDIVCPDQYKLKENCYNTEVELNKNIHSEVNNIKSLLKEFENKIIIKQNYLNNIDLQLNKVEFTIEDSSMIKENEDLKKEVIRLKNSGCTNIFRSNYVEKPISTRKDFFKNTEKFEIDVEKTTNFNKGYNQTLSRMIPYVSENKSYELINNNKTGSNNHVKVGYNENKNESLDITPSKENKFDNISRKIRSLSNQKQNAFNISNNLI